MARVIALHPVHTVACTIVAISVGLILRSARSDYEHRVPSSVLPVCPNTLQTSIRSSLLPPPPHSPSLFLTPFPAPYSQSNATAVPSLAAHL